MISSEDVRSSLLNWKSVSIVLAVVGGSLLLGVGIAWGDLSSHGLILIALMSVLSAGLMFIMFWDNPEWVVVMVVFLLPFPHNWANLKMAYVGFILCAAVLMVLRHRIRLEKLFENYVLIFFFIYLMINILILPILRVPFATSSRLEELIRIASNLSLFLIVASVTREERWMRRVTFALFSAAVVIALVGIFRIGQSAIVAQAIENGLEPGLQDRSFSLLGHPNLNGQYSALIAVLFLSIWAHTAHGWLRLWIGAGVVLVLLNLLMSGSRASILGFAAGALMLLLLSQREGRTRLLALLGLLLLFSYPLVLSKAVGWVASSSRLVLLSESGGFDTALSIRPELWDVAWRAFVSSPILGVGIPNLSYYIFNSTNSALVSLDPEYVKFLPAHNLYLQFLSTTGVVGLVGLITLILSYIRRGYIIVRKSPKGLTAGILAGVIGGMVAMLAAGMVDTVLGRAWSTWQLFSVFLGLLAGCASQELSRGHDE